MLGKMILSKRQIFHATGPDTAFKSGEPIQPNPTHRYLPGLSKGFA
jgi:hypothetical protein